MLDDARMCFDGTLHDRVSSFLAKTSPDGDESALTAALGLLSEASVCIDGTLGRRIEAFLAQARASRTPDDLMRFMSNCSHEIVASGRPLPAGVDLVEVAAAKLGVQPTQFRSLLDAGRRSALSRTAEARAQYVALCDQVFG